MNQTVTVSVCMTSFNGSKYIERQLKSILSQIGVNDEVIIVDDSSLDDTVDIIKNINDCRIKLHVNKVNVGVNQTLNKALQLAQGDLIYLCDQDDFWYEEKVNAIKDIFKSQDFDLLVHDALIVNGDRILSNSLFLFNTSGPGIFKNIVSNTYTGCCMSFRRELLKVVLPIPRTIGPYHDAWIGIISEIYGFKISFVHKKLIEWNRHGSNLSVSKRRSLNVILVERILFISSLIKRVFRNACRWVVYSFNR